MNAMIGEKFSGEQLDPARAVHAGQHRIHGVSVVRCSSPDDADRLPSCMMPELTRPTSMTVIADEDWMAMVMTAPSAMPAKAVLRHRLEGALQRAACQLSQSAGHHVHAIEEERKPAEQSEDLQHCHRETLYFLSVFGKVRPYRTNYTISQKTGASRPIFRNSGLGRLLINHLRRLPKFYQSIGFESLNSRIFQTLSRQSLVIHSC